MSVGEYQSHSGQSSCCSIYPSPTRLANPKNGNDRHNYSHMPGRKGRIRTAPTKETKIIIQIPRIEICFRKRSAKDPLQRILCLVGNSKAEHAHHSELKLVS